MATVNPYTTTAGDSAPDQQPNSAYAVPGLNDDAPYTDTFGWAPKLIPDPSRLQQIPRHDYRPDADRPPAEWWDPQHADIARRESVTSQDADGWEEKKERRTRAPDPRWIPTEEPRPTTRMAPRSYSFTRPWGENFLGIARTFNGLHFSMADHRRSYDILGMAPVTARRNTYRIEPPPWDANVVDQPPNVEPTVIPGAVRAIEVPPSSARTSRSWRL